MILCCVSDNIKADENTSMWVGDSYTISVPTSTTVNSYTCTARSYEYSYDAAFFIMQQEAESENRAIFTLKTPFFGTKTITCKVYYKSTTTSWDKTIEYKYNITCNQVNVALYPTIMSLNLGDSQTLQWQFSHATNPEPIVSFSSNDLAVADVDFGGKVTAKGLGTATITATTIYGTTATCEVTVTTSQALSVQLDRDEAEMHVGETLKLTATVFPTELSQRVLWSSSNPTVARVVGGTVYALDWGECVVTATAIDDSGKSANCLISVFPQQQTGNCDVNNDEVVDIDDVNAVINYILNH